MDKVPFVIFELAHKNETVDFPWRTFLPDDILDYFKALPENGYELTFIDNFDTHLSSVPRPLYLLTRKYIEVKSDMTKSKNMYFYDKTILEAHKGVLKEKYANIHRYYLTTDGKYFIKECVNKGTTTDFQKTNSMLLKHFSKTNKIAGTPKLVDYSLN